MNNNVALLEPTGSFASCPIPVIAPWLAVRGDGESISGSNSSQTQSWQ
jgi:hypothetical protein